MIAIRLVSQAGEPPGSKLEALFGEAGGDIGRGSDCKLVLPDPERRISRKHLQVACRDGAMTLRLISANLIVELDGVPMVPGAEVPLLPGARIRIGPFDLVASGQAAGASPAGRVEAAADEDSMALLRSRPAGPSAFGDLLRAPAAPQVPEAAEAAVGADPARDVDLVIGEAGGVDSRTRRSMGRRGGDAAPVEALERGLGVALPSVQAAELAGGLLQECVAGVLSLLAARAIAKRELGAGQTQLQLRENNPLKFAPDARAALALLLAPPQRGFVAPRDAVRDAFDDLRAHEAALLAGMRAALAAVLDRFDPTALEARLADSGLWDSLVPAHRRARLWERYAEQHAAIAREVEEHFDAIFAGAFAKAYEAQREALRGKGG
jgi:type VI secretion system FHA domain protein